MPGPNEMEEKLCGARVIAEIEVDDGEVRCCHIRCKMREGRCPCQQVCCVRSDERGARYELVAAKRDHILPCAQSRTTFDPSRTVETDQCQKPVE